MSLQNSYCIVGYGNHTKSKILPALLKINKNKIYIVSKKNIDQNKRIIKIDSLDKAILHLNKNILFLIVTPPHSHYLLVKKITNKGFKVLVEKPIFLYNYQSKYFLKINKSNYIHECYMYKYNKIFSKLKKEINFNKENINSIKINFLIPPLSYSSFRNLKKYKGTVINDMACYVISLVNELNFDITNFEILKINNKFKNNKENIQILFKTSSLKIFSNIGYNKTYKNDIEILLRNSDRIIFEKIFYGIKTNKNIIHFKNNKIKKNTIKDINSFEKMFSLNEYNSKIQNRKKYALINKNTLMLEKLRKKYINYKI